jgi:VIT1/CCC1 family predicted Fe2+/Mn2+ transporter
MPEDALDSGKRILDTGERASEVLFGVIMVLTTTCSFSIGGAGSQNVRQMLTGALGCNFAWGIIDAVMYQMAILQARGEEIAALQAMRSDSSPQEADRIIAGAMPPLLASVTSPVELEAMRRRLTQLPEPPERVRLTKDDWLGGLGVFLLVFGATLPVVIPFIFVGNALRALRISNGIAIVMLFLTGYLFGRSAKYHPIKYHPWRMGVAMVLVGCAMLGLTIALGG